MLEGREEQHSIYVLVALAFHGPRPVGPAGKEVRHLDGNKSNNRPENLAYGTRRENALDIVRHGQHREASKTECVNGHPFDEANTYMRKDGSRSCRACRAKGMRDRKARLRSGAS